MYEKVDWNDRVNSNDSSIYLSCLFYGHMFYIASKTNNDIQDKIGQKVHFHQ